MIFKSEIVKAQWDTWCYYHDGIYFLYYLITEHSPGEGFGVATSRDGVHWTDHGWAVSASDKMVNFLGTGSVWPDPTHPGRFLCNYSEFRLDESDKQRQCILFAWSDDLINWTKYGDDYMFRIDERYYERYGRWDCIFAVPRPEGGYFGTWTATPRDRERLSGGIGFGVSEDGLHWQALSPAQIIPDADESGAIVQIDNRIHAMFGSFGHETEAGMHAYHADGKDGPYRRAEKNGCLLKAWHSYFSRYFDTPDGVLVNHHAMNGRKLENGRPVTYLAPFKKLTIDEEGFQRWVWWPGNEKIKGTRIEPYEEADFQKGIIIEGELVFSANREYAEVRIALDNEIFAIQVLETGVVKFRWYDPEKEIWVLLQTADRQLKSGEKSSFRLLARCGMLEFYCDDMFMECCTLGHPEAPCIRFLEPEESNGLQEKVYAWQMDV